MQGDSASVEEWFKKMLASPGFVPSARLFEVVISTLVRKGSFENALGYFAMMTENGVEPNIPIYLDVIEAHRTDGNLTEVDRLTKKMNILEQTLISST